MIENKLIKVTTVVSAPVGKVWEYWTNPDHIKGWNFAIPEWHAPAVQNDLRKGGAFSFRMEAKDGSMGFDFAGIYDDVDQHKSLDYTIADGRKVNIRFSEINADTTEIIESFEPESQNSHEMQQGGWQAILDNFKKYAESK